MNFFTDLTAIHQTHAIDRKAGAPAIVLPRFERTCAANTQREYQARFVCLAVGAGKSAEDSSAGGRPVSVFLLFEVLVKTCTARSMNRSSAQRLRRWYWIDDAVVSIIKWRELFRRDHHGHRLLA